MTRRQHILRSLSRLFYGVSLLVMVLLIVGWVRSLYWRDDISRAWSLAWIERTTLASPPTMACHEANAFWIISSGAGVLGVARSSNEHVLAINAPSGSLFEITWNHDVRPPSSPAPAETPFPFDRVGFGYALEHVPAWKHTVIGAGEQYWTKKWYLNLAFPYWSLVLPLAFVVFFQPLKQSWKRFKRWLSPNLCPVCTYDLRAHHLGDKCPECGTPKTTLGPGEALT